MFPEKGKTKERLDRVATLYLGYKFLGALYFTYPIFYEYASQAITPVQVGIFFSVIGICGFLCEIPTGIIADKRSRKFSGQLGIALAALAPLIIFFGHTFHTYLVAALFYGIGRAFLSGALDSLVYDHKNITKQTYRRINTLEITFGQAGILVSAACGGLLFSAHPGAPFIAETIAGAICFVLIACMQEQYKANYSRPATSHRQHFAQSMRHLFATPFLRIIVLMGSIFSVMLGMCIQFVHEAAMIEHGLQPATRGFLISGAGVGALIILHLFLLRLVKSDVSRIIYMGCGATIAYTAMSINAMPLFFVGYLLWHCLNATSSFLRVLLQDRIPSSHRSTILSNFKALAILLGFGASTATGLLVQWAHTPRAAYTLFGIISFTILLPCTIWLVTYLKKEAASEALNAQNAAELQS